MKTFVDASAFYALAETTDRHHLEAALANQWYLQGGRCLKIFIF